MFGVHFEDITLELLCDMVELGLKKPKIKVISHLKYEYYIRGNTRVHCTVWGLEIVWTYFNTGVPICYPYYYYCVVSDVWWYNCRQIIKQMSRDQVESSMLAATV